jgi:capsular polysaccharide export protein
MPRPASSPPDPLLGPWRPTRFDGRAAAVGRLEPPGPHPEGPLAACLSAPVSAADIAAAVPLGALLAALRVGGEPNLPDPGPSALGVEPQGAVLLLDPHDPARAAAAAALLPAARADALARGLPLLIVRSPEAPRGARPVLGLGADRPGQGTDDAAPARPDAPVIRRVTARLSPWTQLDAAASVHGAKEETALLGLAAGIPVHGPLPGDANPGTALAALFARTRWTCPFSGRPLPPEDALHLLALWRMTEAQNRRVAVTLGMALWKRPAIAALFAHGGGHPPSTRFAGDAISRAKKTGGAIAVWASRAPAGFAEYCAERGIPVLWVEDGFIRSAGLGAAYMPGASYALDPAGPYYDPAIRTALTTLLTDARLDAALLDRARRLRARIVEAGITKYNLGGGLPPLPADGRRRILVPGQVADDLSVLRGAGRIRGNLELLEAVRAEHPDACILYKPHPDVVAGHRKGAVPTAALKRLADAVLPEADIAALIDAVDEVHTLTSLAGFEALLRGKRVVTWGRPFYAGWGLTEDRDPPEGRGTPRTLDELVAAVLILTPRYLDPVTLLPCTPEVLLDRLSDPAAWTPAAIAPLRALQGAARRWLTRLAGRA